MSDTRLSQLAVLDTVPVQGNEDEFGKSTNTVSPVLNLSTLPTDLHVSGFFRASGSRKTPITGIEIIIASIPPEIPSNLIINERRSIHIIAYFSLFISPIHPANEIAMHKMPTPESIREVRNPHKQKSNTKCQRQRPICRIWYYLRIGGLKRVFFLI